MNNKILVTLAPSDAFITLQTYDARHGKSQRFYVSWKSLAELLATPNGSSFVDTDLNNFCQISRYEPGLVHFKLIWLKETRHEAFEGYRQQFDLSVSVVETVLEGKTVKKTVDPDQPRGQAQLVLTPEANRLLANLRKNKYARNALRRFFRDNFFYGRQDRLVIDRDIWRNSFLFHSTTDGLTGGIVPHAGDARGKNHKVYSKVCFAIHT